MGTARRGNGGDVDGGAAEGRPQRLEVCEPRLARDQARIGDGVRGAREQVGEPDGRAQVVRQDPE